MADDETRPADRSELIVATLGAIFDELSRMPPSPLVRELQTLATKYEAIVSQWRMMPPSDDQRAALFGLVSDLHSRVLAPPSSRKPHPPER
jgi:hypothetical protein